jgi:hypothetical protein
MKMKCPHCGITGKAPSSPGGRLVRCPRCTELFLLPELEEAVPSIPSSDLFAAEEVDVLSSLNEEEGQDDDYRRSESEQKDHPDHDEEDILADDSWLAGDFSDEGDVVEPEALSGLSAEEVPGGPDLFAEEINRTEEAISPDGEDEISDWSEEFDFGSEQGLESPGELKEERDDPEAASAGGGEPEELAFAEAFGEELTESFDYQELTDEMADIDENTAGLIGEESGGIENSSDYPDLSEDQVTWRDEQPEVLESADAALDEKEVVVDEEVIQEDLHEMLATTCVACDNKVGEDELYCPDCLKKKEGDTLLTPSADDDSAGSTQTEQQGKEKSFAFGKIAKWGGVVVASLVIIGLLLFLSVRMGWV